MSLIGEDGLMVGKTEDFVLLLFGVNSGLSLVSLIPALRIRTV